MEGITSFLKAAKGAVLNIPEIEQKVLDATNNEKWGPTGPEMKEISQASFRYNDFPIIMATIWKRLSERTPDKWRHVYKALLLLDYMMKNGTDQVINNARIHMIHLQSLADYSAFENNEDKGISVRERARLIVELLHDERRLNDEREKAASNRKKFETSMSGGGGFGGSYSGGYSGGAGGSYNNYNDDDYAYAPRNEKYTDSYSSGGSGNYSSGGSSYSTPGYGDSSSYSKGAPSGPTSSYLDSRPGASNKSSVPQDSRSSYNPPAVPPPSSTYEDLRDEDDDSEDEDAYTYAAVSQKGKQANSKPTSSGRPRAPSGDSTSTPAPKAAPVKATQPPKPATPSIDLLGLNEIPSAQPTGFPQAGAAPQGVNPQFGNFGGAPQANPGLLGNPQFAQGLPQGTNSQFAHFPGAQANPQLAGAQFGGFTGAPVQQVPGNVNWGDFKAAPATTPQAPSKIVTSPPKPQLSAEDAKDPWKKGADLFSLENLTAKPEPSKPVQPVSTGQKIPLNMVGQPISQYSHLRDNRPVGNPGAINPGMNPGMNPALHPGMNPAAYGYNPALNPGMNPAAYGYNPALNPGGFVNPAAYGNPGFVNPAAYGNPGVNPAMNPGAYGMNPAMNPNAYGWK